MPWQLLAGLLVVLATFAGSYALKPLVIGRIIRTALLLCFAAFCAFGFLASFEYPGITLWKIMYPIVGAIALGGATLPWLARPTQSKG